MMVTILPLKAGLPVSASDQITVDILAEQIAQGSAPLILDVRSPEEYAAGHIPGAINIEYRQVPDQIASIKSYLNQPVEAQPVEAQPIVVYCERGIRAGRAETALTEAGLPVLHLRGDMSAWRASELPIDTEN